MQEREMKIVDYIKRYAKTEISVLPVLVAGLLLFGAAGMTLVLFSSFQTSKSVEGTAAGNMSGKTLGANIKAGASNSTARPTSAGDTSAVETSLSSVLGDTTPEPSTSPLPTPTPEPTPPPYDEPVPVDPPLTCKYPKEGTPPLCYWPPCDPCRDSNILCPLNQDIVRYPCAICSSNPEPLVYCPQLD